MSSIAVLVHGGSGPTLLSPRAREAELGCREAARAAYVVLSSGGTALDAVVCAVVLLENNPAFNAGFGSVLNAVGEVECDAAIMDGATRKGGGVAMLQGIQNPVLAARALMEDGRCVLLAGVSARELAVARGILRCDPSALISSRALARYTEEGVADAQRPGTVGAVACDAAGNVAAATSTGGTFRKLPGRIGDSPILGSGAFADNAGAAVSATGQGDAIIRAAGAKLASDRVREGLHPLAAAEAAVAEVARMGGWGGFIVVDPRGRLGWAFNAQKMSFAWIGPDGEGCEV